MAASAAASSPTSVSAKEAFALAECIRLRTEGSAAPGPEVTAVGGACTRGHAQTSAHTEWMDSQDVFLAPVARRSDTRGCRSALNL